MRLILVRHGETLWNEVRRFQGFSDIELSPKGLGQARYLGESLKKESLEAIYSSPLLRARQTAAEIARYHDCPLVYEDGLKELNQGDLEGLTADDLKKKYADFYTYWIRQPESIQLPRGESLGELQRRAWASMEKIIMKHPEGTVVAVAHSFVNLTVLCRVLDIPLVHFRRFRQDATAKNIIEFSERGPMLRCWNDICHLNENSRSPLG